MWNILFWIIEKAFEWEERNLIDTNTGDATCSHSPSHHGAGATQFWMIISSLSVFNVHFPPPPRHLTWKRAFPGFDPLRLHVQSSVAMHEDPCAVPEQCKKPQTTFCAITHFATGNSQITQHKAKRIRGAVSDWIGRSCERYHGWFEGIGSTGAGHVHGCTAGYLQASPCCNGRYVMNFGELRGDGDVIGWLCSAWCLWRCPCTSNGMLPGCLCSI